jgi:hypothetical protein
MGKPTRIGFFWASAACGDKKTNVTKLRTIQIIDVRRILFLLSREIGFSGCPEGFYLC